MKLFIGCAFFCYWLHGTSYDAKRLSLEEKIGQLLICHFHGEAVNEEARRLVQEIKVGGIIYYTWANLLDSKEQVYTLSRGLQQLAKENSPSIPLFLAVDQEGGRVSRLQNGFTLFLSNKIRGDIGNEELEEKLCFSIGEELQTVGISINFAPVVDVNNHSSNSIIGDRSYGNDPQRVADLAAASLRGYQKAHILATLKHFPGYGDVCCDSHLDLPVVDKTLDELKKEDLLPFEKLKNQTDAIIIAHILLPQLDCENPATLSKKILSYLRDEMRFQGLIIADSLIMQGVLKSCHTPEEAAIQALLAGCDMLILGGRLLNEEAKMELTVEDNERVFHAIVDAVRKGRIGEGRIDSAVQRILEMKQKYIRSI